MTPFYLDWVNEAEVGPDPGDREAVRLREEEPNSGSQSLISSLIQLLLLVMILQIVLKSENITPHSLGPMHIFQKLLFPSH